MSNNTLIILDWDDTLFPTSWLSNNNINIKSSKKRKEYKIMFSELDNSIHNFLIECLKYGNVAIITNASYGWLVTSLLMIPQSKKIINDKIKVLSAREQYSNDYSISEWKKLAFSEEIYNYFIDKKELHNIISIGDAYYEYDALVDIYDYNKIIPKKRILKTVKLLNNPTYYTLIDQINILFKCIGKLVNRKKHTDLNFNHK